MTEVKSGRNLFLHVGLPKTGTTALQKWFFDNHDVLAARGVSYPLVPEMQNYKQGYIVQDLAWKPDISRIEQAIDTYPTGDLLFSNEGLSNHVYDFRKENLELFHALTQPFRIVLIVVEREPETWLRSYYRQAVLNPYNPKTKASSVWGTDKTLEGIRSHIRIRRLLDLPRLVDKMTAALHAAEVIRLRYETPDLLGETLAAMGLTDLPDAKLERINESVPNWVISFMRHINEHEVINRKREAWKAVLYRFLDTNHTVLRDASRSFEATPESPYRKLQLDLIDTAPDECPKHALRDFIAEHAVKTPAMKS